MGAILSYSEGSIRAFPLDLMLLRWGLLDILAQKVASFSARIWKMGPKTGFFQENDNSRRKIARFFCEDSERIDDRGEQIIDRQERLDERRESSSMIGKSGSMIGERGSMIGGSG